MELYHLKTFAKVAEEGHLTRAAEKLHTSQPAVSAHIKALEEELGLTLFLRTPKGMRLTPEGKTLYQKALAALATVDDLHHQARRMQHELSGIIRLGLHIDPAYLKIDRLLSKMRRKHIGIEFHLFQRWSRQQLEEIRKGALDAGFIYRNNNTKGLTVTPLKILPVRVVGPEKWQERLNGADWREISQMPWIWAPSQCIFDRIGVRAFDNRNLKPFKVAVADQEPAISALVTAGI
jgi:DNA-binding transcriptional LysR family regulator